MTGSSRDQRRISPQEAVEAARKQRDQLIEGCRVLDGSAGRAAGVDYARLQEDLLGVAPDVADTAWGHKYFSLLYHDLLDDYHSPEYQRYHLIRALVLPPDQDGRYVCAGLFVQAAKELDWHMNHLTTVMNIADGSPHPYWRVGTTHGDSGESEWEGMRTGRYVAVGWPRIGDLSHLTYTRASKEELRRIYSEAYSTEPRTAGRQIQQLFNFATAFNIGDTVLACDGAKVLGIGRIAGEYQYEGDARFPHRRAVEWLNLDSWKMPEPEGLRTTVFHLRKHPANLIEAERRCMSGGPAPNGPVMSGKSLAPLVGLSGRIEAILVRKGQVILYGPPGTGKTHWAEAAVLELAARRNFSRAYDQLTADEKKRIDPAQQGGLVSFCCFHPSYGYEDFIEGYRPAEHNGQMTFSLREGVFKELCRRASDAPDSTFFLLIDEINRGDIPRIFGELIMLVEKTKRGKATTLPMSGDTFAVPKNVYIVGTMNTADRSIALLDTALRRRFGFIEMMPDYGALEGAVIAGVPVAQWLRALNARICANLGRDARNLQVGHSYLMEQGKPIRNVAQFQRAVRDEIIPLLQEYCYEDFAVLEKLLGSRFVNVAAMTIVNSMCDPGHQDDFVEAVLKADSTIQATAEAVEAQPEEPEEDSEGEEADA